MNRPVYIIVSMHQRYQDSYVVNFDTFRYFVKAMLKAGADEIKLLNA